MKRGMRAGVEDRWHRPPRRGEKVPWPADQEGPGSWCTDPRHGDGGRLVTTLRHGRGKRWLARWVDYEGRERTKAFDRKAQAQAHINQVSIAINTGAYADPRGTAVTFRVVAEEWFGNREGSQKLKPKTLAGYRSLLDVVVLPRWGDIKLRDFDHAGLQAWVSWLATNPAARHRPVEATAGKGLSPARVIQAFQVVDQVLSYAVRARYIAANPADGVELPRKSTQEDIALTHEQVRQLAEAAPVIRTMVYLLAYCGTRFGEMAALRVGDVDLARRRIRIARSVTRVTGKGHVEGDTKTHQVRVVPILTQTLVDALAEEIQNREPTRYLFPGDDGGPMTLGWFRWRFDQAAATAGLAGVTPKTLRHTAGSLALASGASVVTVQKLLGHRNATTTMNVYSHMLPDDFDTLAAAMDTAVTSGTSVS
ncbi:integrase [Mycobacterium holsaticum DSM 44478]|nr:integrase [Mycolicibacterium holsaticum DSM 44478 = JCM 12374]QZA13627.1 site-specific integrase [Mycolicibacterium holsaticum DSM 44478 = JCM 12374]UNC08910.1 site-specific integrase [Mycolicibacterium holsaticum DSM 44478 = JCM 12374]